MGWLFVQGEFRARSSQPASCAKLRESSPEPLQHIRPSPIQHSKSTHALEAVKKYIQICQLISHTLILTHCYRLFLKVPWFTAVV